MATYMRHHPDSPFWNFLFAKDELDEIVNCMLAGFVTGTLTRRAIDIMGDHLAGALGDIAMGMSMLESTDPLGLMESEFFEMDLATLRTEFDCIQESATIEEYRERLGCMLMDSEGPFWKFHADLGDVLLGYGGPINPATVPFEDLILMEGWEPPARGRPPV